jgi:hypothetical protein
MEIEIRCCCNPAKVLGTVDIPEHPSGKAPAFRFALPDGGVIYLQVGKVSRYNAYSGEYEHIRALNSNETPIEILRQIPTFKEAK